MNPLSISLILFLASCILKIDAIPCWEVGLCMGKHLEAIPNVLDLDDCLKRCKSDVKCKWTSFDSQSSLCHLNEACYQVLDGDLLQYHRYANRDCGYIGKCLFPLRKLNPKHTD